MGNDLFGGLGGLMKGLSNLMPQDDPAVKMMNAHTQVNDLKKQEKELYAEIGMTAIERYGLESFGEAADRLKLIQSNLAMASRELDSQRAEKEAKEKAQQEAAAAAKCPSCGSDNPEGTKFCQECGTKLGAAHCISCGASLAPGSRFCGECGARQPE